MKMTSLAKFFRFCGYGVAVTALILGLAAIAALFVTQELILPIILGLIAVSVLFVFAVAWIVLSYGLEREGEQIDSSYDQALRELEEFRRSSREWYMAHANGKITGT